MKTKKLHSILFLLLLLLVWLAGCASSQVITDKDPNVDLTKYKTFSFVDMDDQAQSSTNPIYRSSLIEQTIHANIAMELVRRGLREDTANYSDLQVAYHTYTEQKQNSINNYYPMMYGGWGWRFYPWGYGLYPYPFAMGGYNRTYTYTEGTLIIDLIDRQSKKLIWRGSTSGVVNGPVGLQNKVARGVELIFKKFPLPLLKDIDPMAKPVAQNQGR